MLVADSCRMTGGTDRTRGRGSLSPWAQGRPTEGRAAFPGPEGPDTLAGCFKWQNQRRIRGEGPCVTRMRSRGSTCKATSLAHSLALAVTINFFPKSVI